MPDGITCLEPEQTLGMRARAPEVLLSLPARLACIRNGFHAARCRGRPARA